ncbi:hypothetical protein [Arthrobacter sp. LFS091]
MLAHRGWVLAVVVASVGVELAVGDDAPLQAERAITAASRMIPPSFLMP